MNRKAKTFLTFLIICCASYGLLIRLYFGRLKTGYSGYETKLALSNATLLVSGIVSVLLTTVSRLVSSRTYTPSGKFALCLIGSEVAIVLYVVYALFVGGFFSPYIFFTDVNFLMFLVLFGCPISLITSLLLVWLPDEEGHGLQHKTPQP